MKPSIITTATLIPLSFAVACGIGLYTFGRWLDMQFAGIRAEVTQARIEIAEVRRDVNGINGTRWTAQDMEIYALRMKLANPTVDVPDVGAIIQRRTQSENRK